MRRGSIQNGQRGRDSENQSRRNRGGHRSSQTIKHRTTRCRADRAAPANSVGIGEAAGAKNISIKKLREMVFGRRTEKRRSLIQRRQCSRTAHCPLTTNHYFPEES